MFRFDLNAEAQRRYQDRLREAEQWRLVETVTRQQPSPRIQLLVTLAGWLITGGQRLHSWGQRLHDRSQPAPPRPGW